MINAYIEIIAHEIMINYINNRSPDHYSNIIEKWYI